MIFIGWKTPLRSTSQSNGYSMGIISHSFNKRSSNDGENGENDELIHGRKKGILFSDKPIASDNQAWKWKNPRLVRGFPNVCHVIIPMIFPYPHEKSPWYPYDFPWNQLFGWLKLPFLLVFNNDFWCLSHFQSLRFSSSILAFCLELSPSETAGHWRQHPTLTATLWHEPRLEDNVWHWLMGRYG